MKIFLATIFFGIALGASQANAGESHSERQKIGRENSRKDIMKLQIDLILRSQKALQQRQLPRPKMEDKSPNEAPKLAKVSKQTVS